MSVYVAGNLVRVSVQFADAQGTPVDPATVTLKVLDPAGVQTAYTFGQAVDIVKNATGQYHCDIDAAVEGNWRYRWASTGSGQAAGEGSFSVQQSPFV